MWTSKNRGRYDRSQLRYPSDLTWSAPIFRTTASLRRPPPFAVLASCEAIGATGRAA
jgi:hypothetical protein